MWERPGAGTRLLRGSSGVLGAAPYQDKSILGCPEQPRTRASHFWGAQSSPRQGNISLGGGLECLLPGRRLIQGTFGVPGAAPRREHICFGVLEAAPCCTHRFWGAWSSPTPHTLVLGCLEQPHAAHTSFGVPRTAPHHAQIRFGLPRAALRRTLFFWGAWNSPTPCTLILGCPEQPHTHQFQGTRGAAPPRSNPSIFGGDTAPQNTHSRGSTLARRPRCPQRHRPINSRSTRSPSLPINLINLHANEGLGVNEPSRQEAR